MFFVEYILSASATPPPHTHTPTPQHILHTTTASVPLVFCTTLCIRSLYCCVYNTVCLPFVEHFCIQHSYCYVNQLLDNMERGDACSKITTSTTPGARARYENYGDEGGVQGDVDGDLGSARG